MVGPSFLPRASVNPSSRKESNRPPGPPPPRRRDSLRLEVFPQGQGLEVLVAQTPGNRGPFRPETGGRSGGASLQWHVLLWDDGGCGRVLVLQFGGWQECVQLSGVLQPHLLCVRPVRNGEGALSSWRDARLFMRAERGFRPAHGEERDEGRFTIYTRSAMKVKFRPGEELC